MLTKLIASNLAKLSLTTAKLTGVSSASAFLLYQPTEPEAIQKLKTDIRKPKTRKTK